MLRERMERTCSRWTNARHLMVALRAASVLVALSAAACFTGDAASTSTIVKVAKLRGCAVKGSPPPVAAGGYYTNGTTVCTAGGTEHLFHGVDRPSLEWDPAGEGPTPAGGQQEGITAADFQEMAAWRANVVRIALNQDFWLVGAALYNAGYQATVDRAVHDAEAAGLDVILDLHWSDQGNLGVKVAGGSSAQDTAGASNQQQMADVNSKKFWLEVATKYKTDGRVLFELYNEPNGISWDLWLNGGPGPGFTVVGMQELYDTVRSAGAHNLVIAGGLDYAFDLSGVATNPIVGYNVMYATHPYSGNDSAGQWPGSFGYLAEGDIAPVIATEFGDGSSMCTGAWDTSLIEFANTYKISWTAWAWFYPGPNDLCGFPALLSNWSYTPTVQGVAVKAALMMYPVPDAGMDAALDAPSADAARDGHGDDASSDDASNDEAGDALGPDDASDASAATDGATDAALPD
jgi:endoglucanase